LPRKKSTTGAKHMKQHGFTLVELMVAVAIFTFITAMVAGLFVAAIKAQRRILAQQELLDQTSYVVDYMSRALRTVRREINPPRCLSQGGISYELTHGVAGVKFVNAHGECQEFYFNNDTKQLKEAKEGAENIMTSERLQILSFKIALAGESSADNFQPRVTFFFEAQRIGAKPEEQASIKIQTTISQRNLDM